MNQRNDAGPQCGETGNGGIVYDPYLPIAQFPAGELASRQHQHLRRAEVLAAVRRLLSDYGIEGVTMRGIAKSSGYAVQTVYNLAGPRDAAVVEAISEYSHYVGHRVAGNPGDPDAILKIMHHWINSIEAAPLFCRQVCQIAFTPSRRIYYHFLDQRLKAMHGFLVKQQKLGVLRRDISMRELAQQLITFSSALCLEWSDRTFSIELFRRRLHNTYAILLEWAAAPPRLHLRLVPAERN